MKFYQFLGRQALNVNKEKLSQAIQMEKSGSNRQEIWEKTGFFKDADYRWKWEISDLNLKFKDGWLEALNSDTPYLSDIIEHEQLFANYPVLSTLYVVKEKYDNDAVGGYYSRDGALISLNEKLFEENDLPRILSLINHEMGHAVQEIEDFSRGYSFEPEDRKAFNDYLERLVERREDAVYGWRSSMRHLFKERHETRKLLDYAMLFKSYSKLVDYATSDSPTRVQRHILNELTWVYHEPFTEKGLMSAEAHQVDSMRRDLPRTNYKGRKAEYLREMCIAGAQLIKAAIPPRQFEEFKYSDRKIDSTIKSLERKWHKQNKEMAPLRELEDKRDSAKSYYEEKRWKSARTIYEEMGGEVASRAIQAREMMTDQERFETHPIDSYDVNFSDIIPLVGGRVISVDDKNAATLVDYRELAAPASIEFGGDCFAKMVINPNADASSIVHESAHYFLEIYSDLNLKSGVSEELRSDFKEVLDWMGLDEKVWYQMEPEEKEPYHERFAEAFEHYILTNESPISSVFETLKGWLKGIYNALAGENLTSSNELTSIFDKIASGNQAPVSAINSSVYDVVEQEMGEEVAEVTKLMHETSIGYFSKVSGLEPENLVDRYDLEIESARHVSKNTMSLR
ncbi:hypothetical protein QX249_13520 [Vibrio parahaemolyticus]|uniref:Large polyvalent protein associated domain-containing protein n=1 Tax=Vibrio parahaemolyticus TaxID=670 RepID=A0AAW8PZP1_VIBPH|nr:LPD23 domain-containing protein [Vibrio parahaemolyticus]MDS1821672.1 hypothetical protein [Vibrio parahaemolyticus]